MSKFVGGLITGSVLTLVGIGIAAAISDGTLSNPFDAWDVLSGDDDDDDSEEDTEKNEKEDSPNKEDIKEKAKKTGGFFGAGLGILLNAAAAGAESFEKSLSEEIEKSDDSDGEEEAE